MKIRNLIMETLEQYEEIGVKKNALLIGLENQKDDLKEMQGDLRRETDFKDLNITNEEGRKAWLLAQTLEERTEIAKTNEKLQESILQSDVLNKRFHFLMSVYEQEGNIDIEE